MDWLNKKILVFYSLSNILYQIIFAICELFLLRFIEPDLIGIWQIIILIQSYSYISRLGILSALNREYPYALGKEKLKQADELYGTGYSYSWFNGVLLSFVFLVLMFVWYDRGIEWRLGLMAMSVIVLFEMVSTFYESALRSINEFKILAKFQLILIPILIVTLFFPWKLDFMGLCIRVVMIAFTRLLILHIIILRVHKVIFLFQKDTLKYLLNIGWKMWLWGYLKNVNKSIPRLIIATFESTYVLGLFTPVNWMKTIFYNFATSIGSYIYPNLSYQYAKQGLAVGKQTLRITIFTALFSLPFTIVGILLLPYVINFFLPQYVSVILPMQVALVSSIFEIFMIGNMAFATRKTWNLMYWHIGLTILTRVSIIYIFYSIFQDKLLGVAYGLLLSSIIVAIITVFFVKKVDSVQPKI